VLKAHDGEPSGLCFVSAGDRVYPFLQPIHRFVRFGTRSRSLEQEENNKKTKRHVRKNKEEHQ
jgi:hypothetical protein